jgi:hypothetical protein
MAMPIMAKLFIRKEEYVRRLILFPRSFILCDGKFLNIAQEWLLADNNQKK